MIRRALYRKELLEVGRSWTLLLLLAVAVGVLTLSFLASARSWELQRAAALELGQQAEQRLARIGRWEELSGSTFFAHPAAHAGPALVTLMSWPTYRLSDLELPLPLAVGVVRGGAPAEVVSLFLPLLALLASFDAVAGELDRRTLGLLLAAVASRKDLLLAKVGARGLVVSTLMALATAVGALVAAILKPEFAAAPGFVSTALYLTGAAFLGSFCFVVCGIWLSCWAQERLKALLAAIAVWIALAVLLPAALIALADTVQPAPNPPVLYGRAAGAEREVDRKISEERDRVLLDWARRGPEAQQWVERELYRLQQQYREEVGFALRELESDFLRRELASARAAELAAAWLPTRALWTGSAATAGAGAEGLAEYLKRIIAFRQELQDRIGRETGKMHYILSSDRDKQPAIERGRLPRWQPEAPPSRWTGAVTGVGVELAWTAVFGLLAARAFQRASFR